LVLAVIQVPAPVARSIQVVEVGAADFAAE
jgi:hypothetical protein